MTIEPPFFMRSLSFIRSLIPHSYSLSHTHTYTHTPLPCLCAFYPQKHSGFS